MATEIRSRTILAVNTVLIICAMGCLVIYDLVGGLWLKGITSSWFVALGAINLINCRRAQGRCHPFPVLMTLGLFSGLCADVLLGPQFLLGIFSFALGHILYLAAFYTLEPLSRKDLLFTLPIALIAQLWISSSPFLRIGDPLLERILPCYALILSMLLGKAAAIRAAEKSRFRTLLFLGSGLFWFSDLVLSISMFGGGSDLASFLCTYTYWPSQIVLAHSLYFFTPQKPKKA